MLGSGGGYIDEAMKAGAYIRRKGLDTTLYNNCDSACPLVVMAGVERLNWSPYTPSWDSIRSTHPMAKPPAWQPTLPPSA